MKDLVERGDADFGSSLEEEVYEEIDEIIQDEVRHEATKGGNGECVGGRYLLMMGKSYSLNVACLPYTLSFLPSCSGAASFATRLPAVGHVATRFVPGNRVLTRPRHGPDSRAAGFSAAGAGAGGSISWAAVGRVGHIHLFLG